MSLLDKLLVGYATLVFIAALGLWIFVLLPDWWREVRKGKPTYEGWPR